MVKKVKKKKIGKVRGKSVRKMKKKSIGKKSVMKKKSLRVYYKDSWNFLKECRNYILFSILLFFGMSIVVFLGLQNQQINQILLEKLKEIMLEFEGLGIFQTIVKIFLNNTLASLLGIFLGVFLGIFPVIAILVNSYMVGFVAKLAVEKNGMITLWRLVPHGIFELPAVLISFALGIRLGMFIFAKNPQEDLKKTFWNCVKVFLLIILPLLVVAAIIEGILIGVVG